MVDWVIEELRYKAKIFHETGAISVHGGDVMKSNSAIPDSLKERLNAAVVSIEDVPVRYQDFHPGSDEKVIDLVHPSLFPLVYGRSRILPESLLNLDDCIKRCGEGTRLATPSENEATLDRKSEYDRRWVEDSMKPYSLKFQWLPCNVELVKANESTKTGHKAEQSVDDANQSRPQCKITSYINNLHPQKHRGLYAVIEEIISRAIPLWNMTLTPLKAQYYRWERIKYTEVEYATDPDSNPDNLEEESDDDDSQQEERNARKMERLILPEPGKFHPPDVPKHMQEEYFEEGTKTLKAEKTVDLRRDYGKRGLQIIVKLANIHLTPEKPEYEGGTWHVEGQMVSSSLSFSFFLFPFPLSSFFSLSPITTHLHIIAANNPTPPFLPERTHLRHCPVLLLQL